MGDSDKKLLEDPKDEEEETTESHIVVRDESTALGEQIPESELLTIPEDLPILPLRGVVVYPHTVVPLTIGQPRSIRLVDDVAAKDRLIGLVASRKPELELPGPGDLYEYGTVANVQRLFRAPDGTIRMIVQGLARFELGEFSFDAPLYPGRDIEFFRWLQLPYPSLVWVPGVQTAESKPHFRRRLRSRGRTRFRRSGRA